MVDYRRMRLKEYPEQDGVVEGPELMLRFQTGSETERVSGDEIPAVVLTPTVVAAGQPLR